RPYRPEQKRLSISTRPIPTATGIASAGRDGGRLARGFGDVAEADRGQLLDGPPQGLLPLGVDRQEVRVVGGETAVTVDAQLVTRVDHQVDRRADRDVGAHGRVDRDQGVARRVVEGGAVEPDAAVEDRAAVLDLADLEVRAVLAG